MMLQIDYDTVKFQKVTYYVIFNNVVNITPTKIYHQNDVTKIFHF